MIAFSHLGFDMSTSLDWCGLGFFYKPGACHVSGQELLKSIEYGFSDSSKVGRHSFYVHSYVGDGWTFSFEPKKGCKNPPFCLEVRGSFFTRNPQHQIAFDDVLSSFYRCGLLCNPFRIDVCLDIYTSFDVSEIRFQSSFMRGVYYFDEQKQSSGFAVGRGDTRYRLYDKKKEQEERGNSVLRPFWWRWECQLRGEKLKAQFPKLPLELSYLDLYQVGCLCLADRKCVDVSPAFIQAASAYVISGKPLKQKKKKGSWLGSMAWFEKELKRRIQTFKISLKRKYPELVSIEGEEPIDEEWYLENPVFQEFEEDDQ